VEEIVIDDGISPERLRDAQRSGAAPVVIDVRSAEEYAAGHLPVAVHVPVGDLPARLAELPPDRPVVTC
jgi:rhodanese-related sulfurtransferase